MAIGRDSMLLAEKIGYKFNNTAYLDTALTHSSYTNEMRARGIKADSNERLEFLGDAVLEIVVSEYLYNSYSRHREGALTKQRQAIVCEKTLFSVAERLSLGEFINIGFGEEQNGCRRRPKVLADAMEALIAAIYLDCKERGSTEYTEVILRLLGPVLELGAINQRTDYKTMLQQLSEQDGSVILEYRVISEVGPEHDKEYTVAAFVNDNEVGRGAAKNKKDAEMSAARAALLLFGYSL